MSLITSLFGSKKVVIAMIHFPPLIGYKGYPGLESIKKKTTRETKLLNRSGAHSIMVENNYDVPHKKFVSPEITAMMTVLTDLVIRNTTLPVGINVLWNDYRSGLGICAATGAKYIRVPAFVDDVDTVYGRMPQVHRQVNEYQKKLGLSKKIFVFADIQVKHSKMVHKKKKLLTSTQQAVEKGADGIIVTGKWTGDAPILNHLKIVGEYSKKLPVLIGSGSDPRNLKTLLQYSDGIIVGTSIMKDREVEKNKLEKYMLAFNKASSSY